MQYITGTREFHIDEPTVVTLGKFDGLHRGHKKLLDEVFRFRERGYKTAVFTFEKTPGAFVKGKMQTMITTNAERRANLEQAGIDYLVEYPFNQEVAHMMPEDFVEHILIGQMKARAIVAGTDFHFGYQRSGDVELLKMLALRYNYEMAVIEKALDGSREISSTYIREELAAGDILKVNDLLGYSYMIHGEVVHGKHLGTKLGFPTVNIQPVRQKHLPSFGVYLSKVKIDDRRFDAITNIGRKPTIEGDRPAGVETYIYGLDEDLYGKWIEVSLLDFIRPERKFSDVEELKVQVLEDKAAGLRMHQMRKKNGYDI